MLHIGPTSSTGSSSQSSMTSSAKTELDQSIYLYVVIGKMIGKGLRCGAAITAVFAVQQFLVGATLPYIAAVIAAVALWIIGSALDPEKEEENVSSSIQGAFGSQNQQDPAASHVGAPSAPRSSHSWLDWFSSPPVLLADGEPVGFNNISWWGAIAHNCFMHAGLQMILNEPDFRDAILSLAPARIPADPGQRGLERQQGFAYLHQVLQRVSADVQSKLSVSGVETTALRGLYSHRIQPGVQGDTHEFLRSIFMMFTIQVPEGQNRAQLAHPELFFQVSWMRVLEKVVPSQSQKAELDRIRQTGDVYGKYTILDVDEDPEYGTTYWHTRIDKEQFDVQLTIPGGEGPLRAQDLLNHHFASTPWNGELAVYLNQAGAPEYYRPVRQQISIHGPMPKHFFLKLNRFVWNRERGFSIKISRPIEFGERITFNGVEYELRAFANHSGGCGSGHYWAHIKNNNGQWWCANDSRKRGPLTAQDIAADLRVGYVYHYKRVEAAPVVEEL